MNELQENLVVLKLNKSEQLEKVVIRKNNINECNYFEYVLTDLITKKEFPIARSQWAVITSNNLVYTNVDYFINKYFYEQTNESVLRAKIVFEKGIVIEKRIHKFTLSKELILNIIGELEKTNRNKDLVNRIRRTTKLYGNTISKKERI